MLKLYLLTALAALSQVLAWHTPGSGLCAYLGWLSAIFYFLLLKSGGKYKHFFIFGILINLGGFHWLQNTIQDFGGLNFFPASFVFLIFAILSSLQFILQFFLYKSTPNFLKYFSYPISWCIAEAISIRIFPWQLGHTQLGFSSFAQIADIGGVYLISFTMLTCIQFIFSNFNLFRYATTALIIIISLAYGNHSLNDNYKIGAAKKVALVQANIKVQEKRNLKYFESNQANFEKLTNALDTKQKTLVIWPETAIMNWVPADIKDSRHSKYLPDVNQNQQLLTGLLSYDADESLHNSAMLINEDYSIAEPYHKMILMPFGEYTPFADSIPWIKKLNPTAGDFKPGKNYSLISSGDYKIGTLICYEDVVSKIANEQTKLGANLLVNLTNDGWFGDTIAPYQHHLIAAFRAIENRKYLLRSTNSGLTAIVDPKGVTLATLKPYSETVLEMDIYLNQKTTIYNKLSGAYWYYLCLIYACAIALSRFINKGVQRS